MKRFLLALSFLVSAPALGQQDLADGLRASLEQLNGEARLPVIIELMEETFWSESQQAIDLGSEALSMMSDDDPDLGRILYWKALSHDRRRQYDSLLVHAGRIESWSTNLDDEQGRADALYLRGLIHRRHREWDTAIEVSTKAAAAFEAIDDLRGLAFAHDNTARAYHGKRDFDQAAAFHLKALDIRSTLPHRVDEGSSLHGLGSAYQRGGNLDAALQHFIEAKELNEEIGSFSRAGSALSAMGIVYRLQGQYDLALETYQHALAIDVETGNRLGQSGNLNNIGALYRRTGDYELSLEYLIRALAIHEELGFQENVARTVKVIGDVQFLSGDYDSARISFDRSLRISEEMEDLGAISRANLGLAEMSLALGEYANARIYSERVLAIADSLNSDLDRHDGLELAWQAYRGLGLLDEALNAYVNFEVMEDSIYAAESRDRISELQTQYQTKEQAQEIQLLEQESQIQERNTQFLLFGLIVVVVGLFSSGFYLRTLRSKNAEIATRTSELSESEGRMRAVLDTAADAIITIDSKGVIQRVNRATEDIFGYGANEMIGSNVSILMASPHKEAHDGYLSRYRETGKENILGTRREIEARRKDGSLFPMELAVNRFVVDDEVFFSGIIVDITDKVAARESLIAATEAAESANRAKSTFLANMSHEIRTPMNAVIGFTELLHGNELSPTKNRYLSIIQSSGQSLLTLINDILDLSKVEAGKFVLQPEIMDLRGFISGIEGLFNQRAEEKGLFLAIQIKEDTPNDLIFDGVRLRQVMVNLLGNAIKFTEKGGVTLSISSMTGEGSVADVTIAVSDTGIGVPADQLESIFGAFEQTKGQQVGKFGGTGLGLAISKQIVELMDGRIWVESDPGEGSTFNIELKSIPVSAVAADSTSHRSAQITFDSAVILVADDIEPNRELLRVHLETAGLSVVEAKNGKELLDEVNRGRPDLVLTDIRMPEMTGTEAAKILRSAPDTSDIPIVALTASILSDSEEGVKKYCDGFLGKPIMRAELLEELSKYLPHSIEAAVEVDAESDDEGRLRLKELSGDELSTLVDLAAELRSLSEAKAITEMDEFAAKVLNLAHETEQPSLAAWSERLTQSAELFDLEGIAVLCKEFLDAADNGMTA